MSYTLRLQNFQAFKDESIHIDGFTVISGQTDSGKSAIRRALQFIIHNTWRKNWLRHGAKETIVTLESDEWTIKRTKSSTKNSCVISYKDGRPDVVYNKIGVRIPTEYEEMGLKVLESEDGDEDIIISSQLDPLFLISYGNVKTTKVLNKVFDVQKYEVANVLVQRDLQNLKKDALQKEQDIRDTKRNIDILVKINELLQKLKNIQEQVEIIDRIAKLSDLIMIVNNALNQTNNLIKCLTNIKELKIKINSMRRYFEVVSVLKHLQNIKKMNNSVTVIGGFEKIVQNHQLLKQSLNLTSTYLAKLKDTNVLNNKAEIVNRYIEVDSRSNEVKMAIDKLKKLSIKSKKVVKLKRQFDLAEKYISLTSEVELIRDSFKFILEVEGLGRLSKLVGNYTNCVTKCNTLKLDINELDKNLSSIIDSAPDICTYCGNKIDKNKLRNKYEI